MQRRSGDRRRLGALLVVVAALPAGIGAATAAAHALPSTRVTVRAGATVHARAIVHARAVEPPGAFSVTTQSHSFTVTGRSTPARQGVAASPTRTVHEAIYLPTGAAGPLPTVVFAPGFDNQSSAYDPLLRTIASAGFLVIGVDSPGSSSYFPGRPYGGPSGEDLAGNARDLGDALSDVEGGDLGALVDASAVAAVGQSDGGSEVAALALDDALRTTRFDAYVVLSGVVPVGQVPGTFGPGNTGPLLAMVGTADEYGNDAPGATDGVFADAGPTRAFTSIAGASHLSAYIGSGAQADDTRAAITDFLDAATYHDAASRQRFASESGADGLSTELDAAPGWSAPPVAPVVGMAATRDGAGYWVASADGTVRNYGDAPALGGVPVGGAPIVAVAGTPDGGGYWLAAADGGVYAFGDAVWRGGVAQLDLAAPVVSMAVDPATGGYWLLGADGGVFSFGAPFLGSTGDLRLAAPAVGMSATADGGGYWFAAADGGVFAYGDARFLGSMGGRPLGRPVIGMAVDPVSGGYWLDASDGGIFAFGAPFRGSTGDLSLARPMVGMAADPVRSAYWLVAADGGVFAFDAPFEGSGA